MLLVSPNDVPGHAPMYVSDVRPLCKSNTPQTHHNAFSCGLDCCPLFIYAEIAIKIGHFTQFLDVSADII